MRVIAGSARRTNLVTPAGLDTRPTQDRIKETLFNMIGPDVYGSCFLDLFAGSGQMGIEALSRGAEFATFIDSGNEPVDCIKTNINKCHFQEKSCIIKSDVISSLDRIDNSRTYDYVFMDPPYNKNLEHMALMKLKDKPYINDNTIIIVEADLNTDFTDIDNTGFHIIREKTYKTNKHVFLGLSE